ELNLLLPDAIGAVCPRAVGLVADSIEPDELESGGPERDVERRRWPPGPEFRGDVHAVAARGRGVLRLGEGAGRRRQGVEAVSRVDDPCTEEQADIGSIASAERRYRPRPPGVGRPLGTRAGDDGEARQQQHASGEWGHRTRVTPAVAKEQG